MKKKLNFRTCIAIAFVAAAAYTARGSDATEPVKPLLFRAGEIQLDANGYSQTTDLREYDFGGGIGVNYFPWRTTGFGLEAQTSDTGSAFLDRVGVSLIGRMPIEKLRLAPEFKVGYQFDFEHGDQHGPNGENVTRNGHEVFAGIGAEYRLTKAVGFGVEVRGVKPIDGRFAEYLQGIARVRFNF